MKYMFASDLHGSAFYTKKLLEKFEESKAEKLILLGDILYHGPRNNLPEEYNTKSAFAMLNEYKDRIISVRGNCDAEVDQMVLEFPVLTEYAVLVLNGITFHLSHGHKFNPDNLPPMQNGETFASGHIHIPVAESRTTSFGKVNVINPGSVSLPLGGSKNSYGILDDTVFTIYDFDGNKVKEIDLGK